MHGYHIYITNTVEAYPLVYIGFLDIQILHEHEYPAV